MTELQMAVLHLPTGHVVGAITAGRRVPTVEQATGGSHVAVRIPDGSLVRVPLELLNRLTARAHNDVLNQPTYFQVSTATPAPVRVGKPEPLADLLSKAGQEALSVWDGGSQPEIAWQTLDVNGHLPSVPPLGATRRIVAVEGAPLMYET